MDKKEYPYEYRTVAADIYRYPELIQQIRHNFLSNAIKFTDENGQITVRCHEKNGKATVSVKDSGIGMDRSTVTRIFDKFYQGDKSHSGDSNGLGLVLVNRITELCSGTVDVKSELGKGAEFILALPLSDNSGDTE